MKSNLLQEIQRIFVREEVMKYPLPMPTYLHVQSYGRSIEDDMKEIAELLHKKQWFSFKTNHRENDRSILAKFLLEQECRSSLGKEYDGCILVELSGEEKENELGEFLDYIDEQKERLNCVFTIKSTETVPDIRKHLTTNRFLRVIYGEKYDAYEQIEIFLGILEKYQLQLDEQAQKEVRDFFKEKEWLESDTVEILISNMAKSIVYEKYLEEETQNKLVTREDVLKALNRLEEPQKKRQIGFLQEV